MQLIGVVSHNHWAKLTPKRSNLPKTLEEGAMDYIVQTWGGVIGPAFDIVGAILIYCGVRIGIHRARVLEETPVIKTFNDLGSKKNIEDNQALSEGRAVERVKAGNFATIGLFCLVIGFVLQILANWPN